MFYAKQGTAWFSSLLGAEKPCLDCSTSNLSPKSVLDNVDSDCTSYCGVVKADDCEANESRDPAGVSSAQFSGERSVCVEVNEIKDDAEGISACQSLGSRQNVTDFKEAENGVWIINSSATLRANHCHDGISYSEKIHNTASLQENNCNQGVEKVKNNDGFHPLTPPRSPSPDVYSGKPSGKKCYHIIFVFF